MDTQLAIVLLSVFLGLSFFFCASETAFFNLQMVRVHHLVESGKPSAQRVAKLKERPERFLASVVLGNNLVQTAVAALLTSVTLSLLRPDQQGLGLAIATGIATVILVVVGEALPKTLGARYPETVAFLLVRPWELMNLVLFPLAMALYGVSHLLARPFGGSGPIRPVVTNDELRTLVRMGASSGTMQETQAEIITKAFELEDIQAKEIMTPRTDIVFVRKGTSLRAFLRLYSEATHTRFPVSDESDNIVGLLHLKDVVKAFSDGRLKMEDDCTGFARPVDFHPETKSANDLFAEMRERKQQMVILVNEYGGIAGLLTMKVLVGEVVGHITDEEVDEAQFREIDAQTTQVEAGIRVEEANEMLGLEIPEGDYDTLAGYVLAALGHIPKTGEQVRVDGVRLLVSEMKGVKIERIYVVKDDPGIKVTDGQQGAPTQQENRR